MEEYIEATRVLLGVLGHKVLEPLVRATSMPSIRNDASTNSYPIPKERTIVDFMTEVTGFSLAVSGLVAHATSTDEGLVVLEGSEAALAAQSSLSPGYRALREKLIQTGVLVADGNKFRFTKEQLFSSPSQAAAVIVGYAINGRDVWRMPDGKTYGEIEKLAAQISLDDLLPEKQ